MRTAVKVGVACTVGTTVLGVATFFITLGAAFAAVDWVRDL